MDVYLLAGSPGFANACEDLENQIQYPSTLQLIRDILVEDDEYTILEKHCRQIQEKAAVQDLVRGLKYIFRGIQLHEKNEANESLKLSLSTITFLSEATIDILFDCYEQQKTAKDRMSPKLLTLGNLKSFEWEMGVAICSSSCSQLRTPFVKVKIGVRSASNRITHHVIEMNLEEFKEFADVLRSIKAKINNL